MSIQTALDNIALTPTDRWGHTEYSLGYHGDYIASHTGLQSDDPKVTRTYQDHFGFDFRWHTNDGLIDWADVGRVTNMGHAAYAADGSDQRDAAPCPFASVEEVWAFDAVTEYGLPDFDRQVRAYEERIARARADFPNQLTTGGTYRSVVSGAIAAVGWDMLLTAASDPVKLESLLDGFFRRTLFHLKAWAATSVEVCILHDDFVWTSGAFMNPEIYRKVIIPRYGELFKTIRDAGKRILFCSDGDFMEFAGDVADTGADGFIFEPCMDFGRMVEQFGQTHCLVGSYVDCRDLTFGRWDKVQADIDRTFERLNDCRGAIVAVGNHLPPNIPAAMLDRYFEMLLPKLQRRR